MRRATWSCVVVWVLCLWCVPVARSADFLRGDANGDAVIDIGDPIMILSYLFSGSVQPVCYDALDANDSGEIDIADAIWMLSYLFANGPAMPMPFPDPGPDPTPDDLSCGTASSLVLNEILFDPFGDDAGREWVELYNGTAASIHLSGWCVTNGVGQTIAALPAWDMPPGSTLLVLLGTGQDDSDFSDGRGTFAAGGAADALANGGDAVGLYRGVPGMDTIVDFVCWSRDGAHVPGPATDHAVGAGQWSPGRFLDLGFPNGELLRPGGSIGRSAQSVDTNAPEDWGVTGGCDAYTMTPNARNAGPLFSVHDGIKVTQARANIFLVQRGYDVVFASHTIHDASQADDATFVMAHHVFHLELADGTVVPVEGEGRYEWRRDTPTDWTEHIHLRLRVPSTMETFDIGYFKFWRGGRIEQVITEEMHATHEALIGGKTLFEGAIFDAVEPAVEEGTPQEHLHTRMLVSNAHLRLTRTAPDRVMLESTQHVEDDGIISDIAVTKESLFGTDTQVENWLHYTLSSNVEETITVVNHHVGHFDMDVSGSIIKGLHHDYLDYAVLCGGTHCALAGGGSFFDVASQDDGRRVVSWMIHVDCGGLQSWPLGGGGSIDVFEVAGEQIYRIAMHSHVTGQTARMYIDGVPGEVTGVVSCAVGVGLLGFGALNGWNPVGWAGLGAGVAIGLSSYLQGKVMQGMMDEEEEPVDGTPPVGGIAFTPSPSTPDYGQVIVDFTVVDETCIYKVEYRVFDDQGRLMGGRILESVAGRNSQTTRMNVHVPLRNRSDHPVTWTVRLTAYDNAGNRLPDQGQQVTIPGRSG